MTLLQNRDAKIFEMSRYHDAIYAKWDDLDDEDPRIAALSNESTELAFRILLFQVVTIEGLVEKKRIVEIAALESWDDMLTQPKRA